jgi:hypothetical protein
MRPRTSLPLTFSGGTRHGIYKNKYEAGPQAPSGPVKEPGASETAVIWVMFASHDSLPMQDSKLFFISSYFKKTVQLSWPPRDSRYLSKPDWWQNDFYSNFEEIRPKTACSVSRTKPVGQAMSACPFCIMN